MEVPFHRPYITEEEIEGVIESLRAGWLTMGPKTIQFERAFGEYVGAPQAVAVNSCTAALHLALRAIGLQPGDEVLVPTTTFVASAEVVGYFGARPVLVDIEPETHLMDVRKMEEKITPRTRAVIPVHYGGQPCDMDEIMALAEQHRLAVIEDAAHSLPAWYKGRIIGNIGHITAFSFYATKTLATGEGGMATTAREDWADQMRVLRLHGISKDAWKRYTAAGSWRYDVIENGYKYNTTDLNAALGLAQLRKVEWMWQERKRIARRYDAAFAGEKGLIPYQVKPDRVSAWHLYPLRLRLEALTIDRDAVAEALKARGVGISVHFIPLYHFSYYRRNGYSAEGYPQSEWVFERTLSLPIFPGMRDEEIEYVIEAVLSILRSAYR